MTSKSSRPTNHSPKLPHHTLLTTPSHHFSQDFNQMGTTEVTEMLRGIQINDNNIIDSKLVFDIKVSEGNVTVLLNLTKDYRKAKNLVQNSLHKLGWVRSVNVQMAPKEATSETAKPEGLKNVKRVIAVSSCKGGVGKSTVAVNLAYSLSKLGKRVGIFDADIYGPSLPTMVSPRDNRLHAAKDNPEGIQPVEFEGVKTMSYGYAAQNRRAVMRGPMVSALVTRLLTTTEWGDLDFLILDMPPGTGDIQITLCQQANLDAAVIVTTPQKLSFIDVVKGIEMFDDLKVPTISVVENMAHYKCSNCDHQHRIFGIGYINQLKDLFGIKNSFEIPIMPDIAAYSDSGSPVVLTQPDMSELNQIYRQIAESVDGAMDTLNQAIPVAKYEPTTGEITIQIEGEVAKKIKADTLRKACKCALCVDEFTGVQIMDPRQVAEDVYPLKLEAKGNYAVAIIWSDGHNTSIYPY
eukprot:CAMPEP_0115029072 /NCGR_PEP_ID=MMETSP0216-20121206/36749_1 /TAXON_ID=223996 /ORGANISM="Protocruzia adherens, Strain Boccale" /LENGTH=463 /DNA_ID=CAMNT_0002405519 /DNA_START=98 /DNA_END=1486 /DNA_ORIENTATION=-